MNSSDYKKWALTKDRDYTDLVNRLQSNHGQVRLLHAVLGLAGEVGETADAIKKSVFYNKPLDIENIKEEAGDILWYMALLLDEIGSSFEEVMQMNHDKLEKRYPGGFTEQLAQERRDKVPEKEITTMQEYTKEMVSQMTEPTEEQLKAMEEYERGSSRYFTKFDSDGTDTYYSVNQAGGNIWLNKHDSNWKFIASLARLSSFDGTCEDLLAEGFTEVRRE